MGEKDGRRQCPVEGCSRVSATVEHAGATAEETETPGSGTGEVLETDPTRGWNTGNIREEASLGGSGSSGEE